MIRKLRYKFVGIAMLSLLAVLLVVLLTINGFFRHHFIGTADDLLTFLAGNDGDFPAMNGMHGMPQEDLGQDNPEQDNPEQDNSAQETIPAPDNIVPSYNASTNLYSKTTHQQGFPYAFNMNKETQFRTRCFSVTFATDDTVSATRTDRIAAITEDEAIEYAQQALRTGKSRGFTGIYRFYVEEREDGTYVGFLDCNENLMSFRMLAYISGAILAFCLIAMFVLVLFFSNRAIQPVTASVERQKQFITDASHEIKTPLTIINTNAAVLAMTGGENEWIESIRNQARRLDGLVKELLDLSRVEADAPLPMQDFSISEAAIDTVGAFTTLIHAQGKTLASDIEPNLQFHGDEESIRRLISILMDNAVKYAPEKGDIRFVLEKSGHALLLETHNTCTPIEKQHLSKVFERFYRVDASRTRDTGGYGIGLSIAREIVKKHRGKIHAYCPEPSTIVFSATLPIQDRR